VVNTIITVSEEGTAMLLSFGFYLSLMLVIVGAVTVLVFAPKAPHKPATITPPSGKEDQKTPAAAH
jgi:hypothetical protein